MQQNVEHLRRSFLLFSISNPFMFYVTLPGLSEAVCYLKHKGSFFSICSHTSWFVAVPRYKCAAGQVCCPLQEGQERDEIPTLLCSLLSTYYSETIPTSLSVLLQRANPTAHSANNVCLNLLNRKTGESSYWSGLEPLFPVFNTNSDNFWETTALQWGSAMLGSVARWFLLDPLHDGGCFPCVLHSSDHYQVSLPLEVHGESCQACNQLNALISVTHYGFISTPVSRWLWFILHSTWVAVLALQCSPRSNSQEHYFWTRSASLSVSTYLCSFRL